MTLKEKFDNVEIMFEGQTCYIKYDELCEASNQCEQIADEFAIEFAEWSDNLNLNEWSDKTIKELLEIYKKEKQL